MVSLAESDAMPLLPAAGEVRQVMVHFTQETQQRWAPPSGSGSEDGAMLWLPGGVFLELRMESAVSQLPAPGSNLHPDPRPHPRPRPQSNPDTAASSSSIHETLPKCLHVLKIENPIYSVTSVGHLQQAL